MHGSLSLNLSLFSKLPATEIMSYRQWARENYSPGRLVSEIWHPAIRFECELMNLETVQGTRELDIILPHSVIA